MGQTAYTALLILLAANCIGLPLLIFRKKIKLYKITALAGVIYIFELLLLLYLYETYPTVFGGNYLGEFETGSLIAALLYTTVIPAIILISISAIFWALAYSRNKYGPF